ncbi:hypothetical protein AMQ83_34905, partial [Paenibacillus riograndensis]
REDGIRTGQESRGLGGVYKRPKHLSVGGRRDLGILQAPQHHPQRNENLKGRMQHISKGEHDGCEEAFPHRGHLA